MTNRIGPVRAITPQGGGDPVGVNSSPPLGLSPVLTIAEVAALTRHSVKTVRRWLRERRLAGVRVNRRWLVASTSVQQLLATAKPTEAVHA